MLVRGAHRDDRSGPEKAEVPPGKAGQDGLVASIILPKPSSLVLRKWGARKP